ncbi:hypothetical protein ACP70R_030569 [Stipagrostis hirtigluma subsp. patula]
MDDELSKQSPGDQPPTTTPLVPSRPAPASQALSPVNSHHLHLAMASSAGPRLRRLVVALAVLCCLQLVVLAAASRQPLPRPLARDTVTTATATPRTEAAGEDAEGGGGGRRACLYTVQVKTSCSSPRRTPDAVSLAFGDAYGDEVYAAALAPEYGFERCATDTFKISGPCGYGVCYLYLRRAGRVGWTPEWVRVYEPTSRTPSTFYYGDPLPNGVWYGFNRCVRRGATAAAVEDASADDAAVQAL